MYSPTKASLLQLHQAQKKQAQRNCQEIIKDWPQQEAHQRDWTKRPQFCAMGAMGPIGRGKEDPALLTSSMDEHSTLANNPQALPSLTANAWHNLLPATEK